MKKRIILAAMAALLLFALAACSTNEGTKGNMKSTDAAAKTEAPVPAATDSPAGTDATDAPAGTDQSGQKTKAMPDHLMGTIYTMSHPDTIMKNHKSFVCKEAESDLHAVYYQDADTFINDFRADKDYIRIHTREFDGCLFGDGSYNRWVGFEEEPGGWKGLPLDALSEKVQSVEEKDGIMTVTTTPTEEKRQEIIEDEYADQKDKDKIQFTIVYRLAADTLELQSRTYYDTMPDGKEIEAAKIEVSYDVESPFEKEVNQVKEHLKNVGKDRRTTTLIFDPDTSLECSYAYQTAIGDACNLPEDIVKNGIHYQIDRERTIPTNEAKDNDATIYLVPVENTEG